MDYYSEIIGYHANHFDKCNIFLEGGFELSQDTSYLGKGMYFWDNLSNAKFWRKEKVKKGDPPHIEACKIVTAKIYCKELFDFTDDDEREKFECLWLLAKSRLSLSRISRMGFGQILDYVFEFYSDLKHCPVVKIHADYSSTQKNTALFDNTRFVRTIKTIYSVRKDSAISCRKEILEDE